MDVYIVTPVFTSLWILEALSLGKKSALIMTLTTHLHPSIYKHSAVLRHIEYCLSVTS
jgi:hypothetical protein